MHLDGVGLRLGVDGVRLAGVGDGVYNQAGNRGTDERCGRIVAAAVAVAMVAVSARLGTRGRTAGAAVPISFGGFRRSQQRINRCRDLNHRANKQQGDEQYDNRAKLLLHCAVLFFSVRLCLRLHANGIGSARSA